jgi:hypothetical protein
LVGIVFSLSLLEAATEGPRCGPLEHGALAAVR